MKKFLFFLLPFLFFAPNFVFAAGPYVYVMQDGAVTKDTGSAVSWPLASITKLMTALVLSDMKLNWNASVKLAGGDEVGGARLRVAVGGVYRRIDLLHASLMGSANNATNALARTSGLTKAQFVARMNAKAKQLGMTRTHFTDPTGIKTSNVSTAHDIALLIEAAARDERILPIEQKTSYTLQSIAKKPRVHTIKNTDALLKRGVDVQVAKTGYLVESKYNFAIRATDTAGKACTVVVLGAPSMASSIQLASEFGNLE